MRAAASTPPGDWKGLVTYLEYYSIFIIITCYSGQGSQQRLSSCTSQHEGHPEIFWLKKNIQSVTKFCLFYQHWVSAEYNFFHLNEVFLSWAIPDIFPNFNITVLILKIKLNSIEWASFLSQNSTIFYTLHLAVLRGGRGSGGGHRPAGEGHVAQGGRVLGHHHAPVLHSRQPVHAHVLTIHQP